MTRQDAATRTWTELTRGCRVFALATASASGSWSTPLFFAAAPSGFTLYFITSPASRHSREARRDPRGAGSVWRVPRELNALHGAQFQGRIVALRGISATAARDCYLRRHPAAARHLAAATRERFFAFEIDWVKVTDNRLGFGWKEVLRRPIDTPPAPPAQPAKKRKT